MRQIVDAVNSALLNVLFDLFANVAFNAAMSLNVHPDWQVIVDLGGPLKVAELLGYRKAGGVQRVQNWKSRGVPAHVKVKHPAIFLRNATAQALSA